MEIEELVGQTIVDIRKTNDEVFLELSDGKKYVLMHDQEHVYLEDVEGEFEWLI